MTSKLEVANQALVEAGIDPLFDLTDNTREGDWVRLRYETLFERAASSFPWGFCQELVTVGPPVMQNDGVTPEEPAARYAFQYDLPEDPKRCIGVNALLDADAPVPFEVRGRRLLADIDSRDADLVLDYLWRAPEELWSPGFVSFFVLRLAAGAAGAVREDVQLAAGLEARATAELRMGRFVDAKGRTARKLGRSRLARMRVSR